MTAKQIEYISLFMAPMHLYSHFKNLTSCNHQRSLKYYIVSCIDMASLTMEFSSLLNMPLKKEMTSPKVFKTLLLRQINWDCLCVKNLIYGKASNILKTKAYKTSCTLFKITCLLSKTWLNERLHFKVSLHQVPLFSSI